MNLELKDCNDLILKEDALKCYEKLIENGFNDLSDEQKKYVLLKVFLSEENEDKKYKIMEVLRENGIKSFFSYIFSGVINDLKEERDLHSEIEELVIADDNYLDILKKTNELAKELKLTNSLQISNLFTYLLWNGYFSKDHSLKFQSSDRVLIYGHFSFDIMNGFGVCLNFSNMLSDVINTSDISDSSAFTIINVFDKKLTRNYMPEIKRNMGEENMRMKLFSKLMTPLSKSSGNHAFTLIKESDDLYVYDPTNLAIFDVKDSRSCSNICGTGECKLNPYISYAINFSDKSFETLDTLFMSPSIKSPYSRKDYIFTFEDNIENFNNNKGLLEDFHADINNNIEHINVHSKDAKTLIKENKKQRKRK